jgi:DNA-binding IscR family transcriptional regulator
VKNDQGQIVDTGKVSKEGVSQILSDLKKEGLVANGVG